MAYKNPTLTEIVAEIRLESGTLPEKNFMRLINELAEHGLDQQELGHIAIMDSQAKPEGIEPALVPRIRCWDRERIKLVQFSVDAVYVNLIGEYPGWDAFMDHLRMAEGSVEKVVERTPNIVRVAHQTIDKWKAERSSFTIGQYLNCGGPFIPGWYSEVNVSGDISLGQGFHAKDGFNKNINLRVRTSDNAVQFQMSVNLAVAGEQLNLMQTMDQLHDESGQIFEGVITDKVRNEIMGGRR
jgi:uncharacterized protein (TIGR04255 family)